MTSLRSYRRIVLFMMLFWALMSFRSLSGQQTGEVVYDDLGVSFTIPAGWAGQESGEVYVIVSRETPGLIVLIPHDQSYNVSDLRSEAVNGMDLGGGTVLRPAAEISVHEDLVMGGFEGTIEYNQAKAFVVGKVNPYGNGITVVVAAKPELYQTDVHEKLGLSVARGIRFSEIDAQASTTDSGRDLLEDWKYQLSGTRLTYMESYNSGGSDGGGYNMSTEIHLCQEGFFKYYDQSFMSAGGMNRTAVTSNQTHGHGTWKVTVANAPQLTLSFHDGTLMPFDLEWREDTKLFMNGYRYLRTWEGEYAPDCSY